MAPKRGLRQLKDEDEQATKRAKAEEPRPATPVEASIPFQIKYLDMSMKTGKRSKQEKDLWDQSDTMVSPFLTKYAGSKGELDQQYTVLPYEQWNAMKKYNNFISEKH
jgi:hypothetical protein